MLFEMIQFSKVEGCSVKSGTFQAYLEVKREPIPYFGVF